MSTKPYTFDRVVRMIITIVIIGSVLWLINTLRDVLLPFLVACLIAYLFEPFVQYNRQLLRLKGRIVAISLTLFEALLLLGIVGYFFVPSVIKELHQMGELMQKYATTSISIKYLPPELHDLLKRHIDFDMLAEKLLNQDINTVIDNIVAFIHGGLHVVLAVMGWLMVFLYVIFIMLDYDRLMLGFKLMVPPRYRKITFKVGNDIKQSMNHYFRGQALISSIVAVIYCIGFWLSGLPLAVLLGLGTGVLFMIPYCQYISLIPMTLLCLVDSTSGESEFWPMWLGCVATFTAVQIVGDIILTPRVMGKFMGLNPAIILLSLSIWGTLLGFIGLIIALPLTTLLLSYYEQYIIMRNNRESMAQRRREVKDINEMTRR